MWVPLGDFQLDVGFEIHASHPSVGDVLFYPGDFTETELLIAYGACCFVSKMGPLAGDRFLRVVEGQEQLGAMGRKVLWDGAQDVLFEWEAHTSPQPRLGRLRRPGGWLLDRPLPGLVVPPIAAPTARPTDGWNPQWVRSISRHARSWSSRSSNAGSIVPIAPVPQMRPHCAGVRSAARSWLRWCRIFALP